MTFLEDFEAFMLLCSSKMPTFALILQGDTDE